MNILKLVKLARDASLYSDHPDHKLGCVIFDRRGRVMSVGTNWLTKTHPFIAKLNSLKTVHAETDAIFKARKKLDLTGMSLMVYREHKNGSPALARPCEMCMQVIKLYGIKCVWYSTQDGIKKELVRECA